MSRLRKPPACTRALLALLCALLLFAQHTGLTHAVWHAAQHEPAHAGTLDRAAGDSSETPGASKLCPLDAMLGQVLGAGPVSTHALHAADRASHTLLAREHALHSLPAPAPRSRGPPALL